MEFAYFQLINTRSLNFVFPQLGILKFLDFFVLDPLKTQKVHGLISGIPVHGIWKFSGNLHDIFKFCFSAARNFEIFGFFRVGPLKITKGPWFDFWYPCAWNLHILS